MSKRSKACDISQKVKEIVWNRDEHKCTILLTNIIPKLNLIVNNIVL